MAYPRGVNFQTTTVSSTSTPVQIMPAGFLARGFQIKNRGASAQTVLVWAFQGTLPVSQPAGTFELPPNTGLPDNITSSASGADDSLGWAWAAVLLTAGSATVDAVWS